MAEEHRKTAEKLLESQRKVSDELLDYHRKTAAKRFDAQKNTVDKLVGFSKKIVGESKNGTGAVNCKCGISYPRNYEKCPRCKTANQDFLG